MLEFHDRYGAVSDDLAKVAKLVAEVTGLELAEDDDFGLGGQFFAHSDEAEIIVHRNWNPIERVWTANRWREFRTAPQ